MQVTTQEGEPQAEPQEPHVLIVGGIPTFRGHLKLVLRNAGITSQGVASIKPAVNIIEAGEPPVTGVITASHLKGHEQVIEAAKRAGVNAALMTQSSLTQHQAQKDGLKAYMQSQLTGSNREPGTIADMIATLTKPIDKPKDKLILPTGETHEITSTEHGSSYDIRFTGGIRCILIGNPPTIYYFDPEQTPTEDGRDYRVESAEEGTLV